MRLIYLVQYFPPEKSSGLDLVENLLEGFSNQGWYTELYTPTPTKGVSKEQRKRYSKARIEKKFNNHLTIHRMHLYREGKSTISRAIRYFLFSIECFWKVITVPADFVFTGSGPPSQGVIVGLAKKISKKKKVIYNLQDIFPDSLITSEICDRNSIIFKIGRRMEDFTYRNADAIITITEDMKRNTLQKGVKPNKVYVVRNWIDTDRVVPFSNENNKLFEELKLSKDKFYVVYAGNLGKVQGVETIVESAKQLVEYSNIHFLIFGNGSEEERIKAEARCLPNVSIFPLMPQERAAEVYSLGDVSIVSCRPGAGGSGMPSKTWTIMATGTPIIASFDLGGEMEKTIVEANCGKCVEAGNVNYLASTIIWMYNNTSIIEEYGKNARKYAEKRVNKEQAVSKYIEIINSTMNL